MSTSAAHGQDNQRHRHDGGPRFFANPFAVAPSEDELAAKVQELYGDTDWIRARRIILETMWASMFRQPLSVAESTQDTTVAQTALQELSQQRWRHVTVYLGWAGLALLHLFIAENREVHARAALEILQYAQPGVHPSRVATFLEGLSGIFALRAVACHRLGDAAGTKQAVFELCRLWDGRPWTVSEKSDEAEPSSRPSVHSMPASECEVLYGRSGYLYSLLFVLAQVGPVVPAALIGAVANAIVSEGRRVSELNGGPFTLTYFWHDSLYLGGAHGVAGICLTLLQAQRLCSDAISDQVMEFVFETTDQLVETQFSNGTFPTSFGKHKDDMVQWCHGAPGLIPLLLHAAKSAKSMGNERRRSDYEAAARRAAAVVWEQGLLRKGVGLCHGIGGNGLALLCMYRDTNEPMYLQQARAFASYAWSELDELATIPDRPLSLFEGIGGLAALLLALEQDSAAVRFPAYEV